MIHISFPCDECLFSIPPQTACLFHEEDNMKFDEYDENVQEWVEQVLKSHTGNPDMTRKFCRKILRLGEENQDSRLLGFAYFYLAESYYFENNCGKFMKFLYLGIEHQNIARMGDLLVRSYNFLGINFDNQGNIPAAVDFYLTSLQYCREYGMHYEAGLANCNIGQLYYLLHEYKTAVRYLKKARKCLNTNRKDACYSVNMMSVEISLAFSYFYSGNLEPALRCFYKIEEEDNKLFDDTYKITTYIFEIIFNDAVAEYAKRDSLIQKLISLLDQLPSLMDMYDDAFMFCEFLLQSGRYQELLHVLERIELLSRQAGITNMQLRASRYRIQYCQAMQQEADYLHAYAEYFRLSEQMKAENIAISKKSIDLRLDMEHVREKQRIIQKENEILQEKSERDPLTHLPNRSRLNDYSETAFENAYRNGTSLAVEILDIDFFKQYNDTYGHQAGDECLKKIAKLLHSLAGDGIFCARYGGDEFIIIYENKTDAEILEIAEKLQRDVTALHLENIRSGSSPVVTISQGIRNSIPQNDSRVWDYLYAADMSLYHVKRTEKNSICLINRLHVPDE